MCCGGRGGRVGWELPGGGRNGHAYWSSYKTKNKETCKHQTNQHIPTSPQTKNNSNINIARIYVARRYCVVGNARRNADASRSVCTDGNTVLPEAPLVDPYVDAIGNDGKPTVLRNFLGRELQPPGCKNMPELPQIDI